MIKKSMTNSIAFIFVLLCSVEVGTSSLPLRDSASIDGITWRFSQKDPVGRFGRLRRNNCENLTKICYLKAAR